LELAEKLSAEYTHDLTPILNDGETQVIVHGLPTIYRLGYLREYVKAGKHILCEKPLARTLDEAKKIVKLVRNYSKTFYVAHVVRFFWDYEQAYRLVKEKSIGRPAIVRVSRCASFPSFGKDDWYADFDKSGGAALDLSVHDFDFLLWTFGRVKRIFASGLTPRENRKSDYMLAVMNFHNGMIGHLEAGWCEPKGNFWTAFEIAGDEGLIEYDSRSVKSLVLLRKNAKDSDSSIQEIPLVDNPYLRQMRHFLSCVENGKKPLVNVDDAYRSIELAIAALDSINSGKPITLKSK
jgi:predicted dehydrogenase